MVFPPVIFPSLAIASGFGLAGIVIYSIRGAKAIRAEKRAELSEPTTPYFTACAGSPGTDTPRCADSIPMKYNTFRTKDGKIINPKDYLQFIVKGDSMRYYGIHDGDIIFVRRGFKPEDLTNFILPKAIVIKRRIVSVDESEYKVRRAWAVSDIEGCRKMIDAIIESRAFDVIKEIKDDSGSLLFNSVAVLEDFERERLPRYRDLFINCENPVEENRKLVISTTYDTKEKKIHFSLHPISLVVGIVSESYTIKSNN